MLVVLLVFTATISSCSSDDDNNNIDNNGNIPYGSQTFFTAEVGESPFELVTDDSLGEFNISISTIEENSAI